MSLTCRRTRLGSPLSPPCADPKHSLSEPWPCEQGRRKLQRARLRAGMNPQTPFPLDGPVHGPPLPRMGAGQPPASVSAATADPASPETRLRRRPQTDRPQEAPRPPRGHRGSLAPGGARGRGGGRTTRPTPEQSRPAPHVCQYRGGRPGGRGPGDRPAGGGTLGQRGQSTPASLPSARCQCS